MTGSEFRPNGEPSPYGHGESIPPTIETIGDFKAVVDALPFVIDERRQATSFSYMMPQIGGIEAKAERTMNTSGWDADILLSLQYGNRGYRSSESGTFHHFADATGMVEAIATGLPEAQGRWLKEVWAVGIFETDRRAEEASRLLEATPFPVGNHTTELVNKWTPRWEISGSRHTWDAEYMQYLPLVYPRLRLQVGGEFAYDYMEMADGSQRLIQIAVDPSEQGDWTGMSRRRHQQITDQSIREFTGVLKEILAADSNH